MPEYHRLHVSPASTGKRPYTRLLCSVCSVKLSSSISPYLYRSWHLPSSPQDPLLPAGLPLHLTALLLLLRFGLCWPLCVFINYIYLLTFAPHCFTTSHRSIPRTTRWSVRPFLQDLRSLPTDEQTHETDHATCAAIGRMLRRALRQGSAKKR